MNKNDFLTWLSDRYDFDCKKKSDVLKYDSIVERVGHNEYNYHSIKNEIIETKFYGFPGWADLIWIFDANIIIQESDKKENSKGEWVCRECGGKKGKLVNRKTSSGDFDFFIKCKTCDGVGYDESVKKQNIFKDYDRENIDQKLFEKELRVLSKNLAM